MKNLSPRVELVNQIVKHAYDSGIAQVRVQDHSTNGRHVTVDGKRLTYFGNCSYLGLELDPRIKNAAIDAINRYGNQFACSRSYAALTMYDELEYQLEQIFDQPTLVTPTTTLGHIATISTLINQNDAVILDHQVHASVQMAVQIVKANGTHVEVLRHNRMDILESRIKKLSETYSRIWYMSDGIYSMYGDSAPLSEMHELMNKYENFWCYIDDAHGMSWAGERGSGYALSQFPSFHNQLILAASLVKGFGVHGGCFVFPNREMRDVVRNCGSTLMFSSPMPPVTLASCIESTKIHLTDEIYELQAKLMDRIHYFNLTAKGLGLPIVSYDKTPIFFVGLGTPENGYEVSKRMMKLGFLLNIAAFPAVPYKNTGLRANLCNHITLEDIFEMLTALDSVIKSMEKDKMISKSEINKAFALASAV